MYSLYVYLHVHVYVYVLSKCKVEIYGMYVCVYNYPSVTSIWKFKRSRHNIWNKCIWSCREIYAVGEYLCYISMYMCAYVKFEYIVYGQVNGIKSDSGM